MDRFSYRNMWPFFKAIEHITDDTKSKHCKLLTTDLTQLTHVRVKLSFPEASTQENWQQGGVLMDH